MSWSNSQSNKYDRYLLLASFSLLAIGLLMVTSASMVIAERQFDNSFYYLIRQLLFICIGLSLAGITMQIPIKFWEKVSPIVLLISLLVLILVLIPGIGRQINGSTRWIGVGPIGIQVSEIAKLGSILYLSGYLVRRQQEICSKVIGFIKPMIILSLFSILLLCEPDFGATVVIMGTALLLMFIAGVRLTHFAVLLGIVMVVFAVLAISSPYRLLRLTTFLNPWANQFDSGYQLTQSLIAFGRGGWFGVGLGASVQKLFYLPEAHTDFLFAVLAEELGLVGIIVVIGIFSVIVLRMLMIARHAQRASHLFAAYVAYGIGLWIGIQTLINLGVSAGALPTKGLTLPLMSSGGSSILVVCVAIAIVIRIDYETRGKDAPCSYMKGAIKK